MQGYGGDRANMVCMSALVCACVCVLGEGEEGEQEGEKKGKRGVISSIK